MLPAAPAADQDDDSERGRVTTHRGQSLRYNSPASGRGAPNLVLTAAAEGICTHAGRSVPSSRAQIACTTDDGRPCEDQHMPRGEPPPSDAGGVSGTVAHSAQSTRGHPQRAAARHSSSNVCCRRWIVRRWTFGLGDRMARSAPREVRTPGPVSLFSSKLRNPTRGPHAVSWIITNANTALALMSGLFIGCVARGTGARCIVSVIDDGFSQVAGCVSSRVSRRPRCGLGVRSMGGERLRPDRPPRGRMSRRPHLAIGGRRRRAFRGTRGALPRRSTVSAATSCGSRSMTASARVRPRLAGE